MSNYYYTDTNGTKQGPVNEQQLQTLIAQGAIVPDTPLISDTGHKGLAGQIPGLNFNVAAPPRFAQTAQATSAPPSIPTSSDKEDDEGDGTNHQELSRAIFIFLAVCVGIFGVHDFYAKHNRRGWIHLALVTPWILVFVVSILGVFGYTLYALNYSPYNKEIRACEKSIKDCEKEIEETKKKLQEALEGKLRKARPDVVRVEPREEPRREEQRRAVQSDPPGIDRELVRELRDLLDELESRLWRLQSDLSGLKTSRAFLKADAWIPARWLWLYFVFGALPILSWAMAMLEIVYVTRDGNGRPFGF